MMRANNQPYDIHQLLANALSPNYIVYGIDGCIGVTRKDLGSLNPSDKAWVMRKMSRLGINVHDAVSGSIKETYEDGESNVIKVHDVFQDNQDKDYYPTGTTQGMGGADVFMFWGSLTKEEAVVDIKVGRDIFILSEAELYKLLTSGKIDHTKGHANEDGSIDERDAPNYHPKKGPKVRRKAQIFIQDEIKKRLRYHIVKSQ